MVAESRRLQKPVRRNFKRAKVIVSGPNEQLDVDWADMQSLSKDNDGIEYLLVAMDVFSRYAWVEPMKNKTAKEVERGLMIIFNQIKPRKIRTDGGSEFNNRWVKTLLENRHMTMNEVKANYVERFNRTIKTMIYRYLNRNKTPKYLDVLPKLIETYNATPHRSLNNIAPKDVNETNEADMWAYMYLKPKHMNVKKEKTKRKRLFRFKLDNWFGYLINEERLHVHTTNSGPMRYLK
jgi:transposase InsO family protein